MTLKQRDDAIGVSCLMEEIRQGLDFVTQKRNMMDFSVKRSEDGWSCYLSMKLNGKEYKIE